MDKQILYIGGIIGMILLVYYNIIQYILIHIYALGFLMYETVTTIHTKPHNIDQLLKLLQLWTMYILYVYIEKTLDYMFYYLPFGSFYLFAKMGGIVWLLTFPEGVINLYNICVLPSYEKMNTVIKKGLDMMDEYFMLIRDESFELVKKGYIHGINYIKSKTI